MWERFVFIVTNLKTIALVGAALWVLVVLTLDIVGLIDLKVDCPTCVNLLGEIVSKASAADLHTTPAVISPVTVRLTILP